MGHHVFKADERRDGDSILEHIGELLKTLMVQPDAWTLTH